jgi:hypothetical protein
MKIDLQILQDICSQIGKPNKGENGYCLHCETEVQSSDCHLCKESIYIITRNSPAVTLQALQTKVMPKFPGMRRAIEQKIQNYNLIKD